jgi:hypothetical protein
MGRRSAIFIAGILLIALCGCLSRKVEHQVLELGIQAGAALSDSHFAVVNTKEEFSGVYRKIHSGELPPPEPPPVDFSKSFILVIAMGEKPTAGYALEIGQVVREGSRLVVEVRSIEPDSERMQATVITRPYALIRIERQPGLETAVFVDPSGKRLADVPLN